MALGKQLEKFQRSMEDLRVAHDDGEDAGVV